MQDHVYKMIELAGSSESSIEDAVQNAVARAAKTLHDLRWFEVVETGGHIENGRVAHYQVVIKVGFTVEDQRRPPPRAGWGYRSSRSIARRLWQLAEVTTA